MKYVCKNDNKGVIKIKDDLQNVIKKDKTNIINVPIVSILKLLSECFKICVSSITLNFIKITK